jgi:hypothetical protein
MILERPWRMAWRVMIPKKISTMFIHDRGRREVQGDPRVLRQPRPDRRVPMGGEVIHRDVQLLARVTPSRPA